MKARSHLKKDEVIEAKKLYLLILQAFPKNLRAHQGLTALNKTRQNNTSQNVPQEIVDQLVNLYNHGKFLTVVEQAQDLTNEYPKAYIIWNILGASIAQIGKLDEAIEAYNKSIVLKPDYAEAYSNMGNALKDQGKLEEAIKAYNKSIAIKPDFAEAYNNMGAALKDQGKLDEAIEAYNKSIALKPDYAEAYNNMGNALQDQGKFEEAIEAYNKALSLKPDNAEAYNNMGLILKDQGKLDEAIEAYNKSIALKPDYAEAYNNMGNALQDQGKFEEAIEAYNKALSLKPDNAVMYSNMGNALKDQGNLDKAIEAFNKSIVLKPDYAEAYSNMGNALQDQGKFEEAIEAYNKALSLKPDNAVMYSNMGNALKDQGNLDKAIEAFNKSIVLKPDYAAAYSNMGIILQDLGKLEEAIQSYKKAIELKQDFSEAHHNLSYTYLAFGILKEGFNEYEWRWKTPNFLSQQRNFSSPIWDGKTSLKDKTILLWCEQGIGDTMNWSSCLNLVTACAKHVILECQNKLVPLLSRSFPNVEVKAVDRSSDADRDDFDLHLPMGSLYKNFIHEIMENGMASSYLVADPDRVKFWKDRLHSIGMGPYIGVCWKSSVKSVYRQRHYPPMSEWAPVFKAPNITFINLQYKDYEDDIAQVKDELGVTIHNLEDIDQYGDIDEVAALCGALDMVVSTKATPPMISAGVGTPTKIANWRQSTYNTILTNPQSTSLEMIHKDTTETWNNVFNIIRDYVLKMKT
jgi:tetratricopeptide (TPR) repeat protein